MKLSTIVLATILIIFTSGILYAISHPGFAYKGQGTLDAILR